MKQTFIITIEQSDDAKPISPEYVQGRAYGFGTKKDSVKNVKVEKRDEKKIHNLLGINNEYDILDISRDLIRYAVWKYWHLNDEEAEGYLYSDFRCRVKRTGAVEVESKRPEFKRIRSQPALLLDWRIKEALRIPDDTSIAWAIRGDGVPVLLTFHSY